MKMIKSPKYLLYQKIFFFLALLISTSMSQDSSYQVKINLNPDNHDYWWLNNNNNGKDFNEKIVDFSWDLENKSTEYQIILSNGLSSENKLYIGESFIKKSLSKNVTIKLGKYYRDFSLYLNDNLSSGSMLISHNAEPMPKIGLSGIIPFNKNKNISFNWGISHGEFDKNEYYSKAPFLHEKFIYINFKKKNKMTAKNKKIKVLFVYPNEREMSTIPPAITLLSQLLKDEGHTTDVFDTTF